MLRSGQVVLQFHTGNEIFMTTLKGPMGDHRGGGSLSPFSGQSDAYMGRSHTIEASYTALSKHHRQNAVI